jgi:DNA-binding HxlR family transcriptional regulator
MLRTKAQEKIICSSCPVAKTAHLIGDSFLLLIVRDLEHGPKRFKDFEESLPGVSTRTLTKKLSLLIEKGLIVKEDNIYTLTKEGKGLSVITKAMELYGKKYL